MDIWPTLLGIVLLINGAMTVLTDDTDGSKSYMEACAKQELFANVPPLNFTCADKVAGGYYADVDTGCHIFHLCAPSNLPMLTDHPFCCHPELVFDQRFLVCDRPENVDCPQSSRYFSDQFDGPVKVLERETEMSETQARSWDRKSREGGEDEDRVGDHAEEDPAESTGRNRDDPELPSLEHHSESVEVVSQLADSPGKAVTLPPAFRQR